MNRFGAWGALLVLALVLPMATPWQPVIYNPDEGQELLKARHVAEGYALYADIWCDQVPLHTYALSAWMQVFDFTLLGARSMTLVLAAVAGASLWRLVVRGMDATTGIGPQVDRELGVTAGVLALLLLVASERFPALASAAMIGPPSIFLGIIALDLVTSAKRSRSAGADFALVAVAGLVFAASVMFKLLTFPMAAVLGLVAVIEAAPKNGWESTRNPLTRRLPRITWRSLGRGAILATTAAGAAIAVAWAAGVFEHWDQAVGVAAAAAGDRWGIDSPSLHIAYLLRHQIYLPLAAAGLVWGLIRGWRGVWPAVGLAAVMALALAWHRPLRYHSALALTIPLCWLGAYGLAAVADVLFHATAFLTRRRAPVPSDTRRTPIARLLAASGLVIASAGIGWLLIAQPPLDRRREPIAGERVIDYESQYKRLDMGLVAALRDAPLGPDGQPTPAFSDLGYYTFLAGRPSPPWLAVVSLKRSRPAVTGQDWPEEIVQHLRQFGVTDIALARFNAKRLGQPVADFVEDEFELVYHGPGTRLFRRASAD